MQSDFSPIIANFADVDSIEVFQNVVQRNPKDAFLIAIYAFLGSNEKGGVKKKSSGEEKKLSNTSKTKGEKGRTDRKMGKMAKVEGLNAMRKLACEATLSL